MAETGLADQLSENSIQDEKARERALERALVERAQDNDTLAYERLYQMHIGRVFALCVRPLQ